MGLVGSVTCMVHLSYSAFVAHNLEQGRFSANTDDCWDISCYDYVIVRFTYKNHICICGLLDRV